MPLPRHAAQAILTFLAIAAVPELVPPLRDYRLYDFRTASSVLDFVPRRSSPSPLEDELRRLRPEGGPDYFAPGSLDDAGGSLDRFYAALLRAEQRRAGGVVNILHYGDSPITADLITADAREALQREFGDAGHGFCLIARPWAWYEHRGVSLNGKGWKIDPANQTELRDGLFGLGGVSFRGGRGAWCRAVLRDAGHTSVEVSYLCQPGGGVFELAVGASLHRVDTAAQDISSGYAVFPVPPAERRFELRVIRGPVRLFGFRFAKPGPGLVYSNLGVNGAYIAVPARMFRRDHWAGALRRQAPSLVVLHYGTNESVYPDFLDSAFASELEEAVRRVRAAVPDASILIMSPMDRGRRDETGEIGTVPGLARVVAIEQRVARRTGCAFFNTFQAMGGAGTMARWYQAEPRLVSADFIHPLPAGARIVARLYVNALLKGYYRYKHGQTSQDR